MQVKRLWKELADQQKYAEKELGARACCGKDGDGAEKDCENNKAKKCDMSFKPTSYGGCEGQKDLQTEKVAEKLALLDDCRPKLLEKVADADQNNNNFGIENILESGADFSVKTTSYGDCEEQEGQAGLAKCAE